MGSIRFSIRPETKEDAKEIYTLIKLAFQQVDYADGDEQDYVVALREKPVYLPDLALVAEYNGRCIGHIMFTEMYITGKEKNWVEVLLSPVSVLSAYQNQGVGSALIQQGMQLAKNAGYSAVFLCGAPGYYRRFGFIPAEAVGILHVNCNIPKACVMVCKLTEDALQNVQGTIDIC